MLQMKLEIFGHTRMHFNHLSRASIVVRFHLPAGAAGRVACTPLASPLSLPLSPCLCLFLTVAALLSALNEFYSCVGVEAHDKCDERIKRKTPHSFSCPPSSATHTPQLSLSLSFSALGILPLYVSARCLLLEIEYTTWCTALSLLPGNQPAPSLPHYLYLYLCLSPSISHCLFSLSLSPHRSARINYCN